MKPQHGTSYDRLNARKWNGCAPDLPLDQRKPPRHQKRPITLAGSIEDVLAGSLGVDVDNTMHGLSLAEIAPESDSLDQVEAMMVLEDEFGIEFSEDMDTADLPTLGHWIAQVEKLVNRKARRTA